MTNFNEMTNRELSQSLHQMQELYDLHVYYTYKGINNLQIHIRDDTTSTYRYLHTITIPDWDEHLYPDIAKALLIKALEWCVTYIESQYERHISDLT